MGLYFTSFCKIWNGKDLLLNTCTNRISLLWKQSTREIPCLEEIYCDKFSTRKNITEEDINRYTHIWNLSSIGFVNYQCICILFSGSRSLTTTYHFYLDLFVAIVTNIFGGQETQWPRQSV